LPEIFRLLLERGALVLSAEPGAGKTSLVPQAVAEALASRSASAARVLLMEPRRVAAIAAAARIAELWGKKLGKEVGYRVRGETSSGPRARVEVVTPGVLLRMIQSDPGLEEAGCVILDEFHERSAQADLAFALLAQARELRPGLGLIAMSATMDCSRTVAALGAALLEVPGRSYPIETRHLPLPEGRGFEAALAREALGLIEEAEGDVLVFLPGVTEILRAVAAFEELARASAPRAGRQNYRRTEAIVLHGSLTLEAQRRVLAPPAGCPARAIFATSIAETSLTVPRVRAVLDSGQARLSRFQPRAGLNRLVTEREAQDRADQRRGRAGRLGPGLCLRAWSASEVLPSRTEPEILRAELSSLVLEASLWGAPGRLDLPWLDPPPEAAWKSGKELLIELGALDGEGSPTDFGRKMAALGTEPRLAALVLRGIEAGSGWTACLLAALLSERGPSDRGGGADIAQRAHELGAGRGEGSGAVIAEARRLARLSGAAAEPHHSAAAESRHSASAVRGAAAEPRRGTTAEPHHSAAAVQGAAAGPFDPGSVGSLLAAAFPDRLAQRTEYRGGDASFRIAAGRSLRASGSLAQAAWIVALDADAGTSEGRIYSGAPLDETEALAVLKLRGSESLETEWRGLEPKLTRVSRAGVIVLGKRPAPKPSQAELASLLAERIRAEGLGILPWDGGAAGLLARLRFFAASGTPSRGGSSLEPAELSEQGLAARAADWLGPHLAAGGGPLLDGPSLKKAVLGLVPHALRAELDSLVPERLDLPSGSSRPIDYAASGAPAVEARVQEFFGLAQHPRLLGQPLVLRLLDPGGKPLQVTSDLPGFWKGSWAQARKELRGRYPKHEWPEDPALAAPSRSGIKQRAKRPK
jgi:ATP-dependent helicase HrpB